MSPTAVLAALLARVVFSFADPAIDESSGLVDLGGLMVTTDDSGGDPLVFVVDPRTGRTVGHTTFTSRTVDVEALAPAGAGAVWVGDIGDNDERRDTVQVYRVPVGSGDRRIEAPAYQLVYPDGSHDAESLVAAPGGRLYVITKGILGGTAYAAPRHLDLRRANKLRPVAPIDVWATDAALFPDGRHVLVRGYDTAAIYSFPDFRPVATLDLPRQQQGEGVSIAPSGRVRLSSEGVHSRVLQVDLPDAVRAVVEPHPDAAPAPPRRARSSGEDGGGRSAAPAALLAGGIVGAVGIAVWRGRRRRTA